MDRPFFSFQWKDANYRISGNDISLIIDEIKYQRKLLEEYIKGHREFQRSMVPLGIHNQAPEIVSRMAAAANITGTGPMAAVAGTIAQMAVEKSLEMGQGALVENGGDIFLALENDIIIGLYPGAGHVLSGKLALKIRTEDMPMAICSSSSKMGHSISFGDCDLATVLAVNASLADGAATMACNSVKCEDDLDDVIEWLKNLPGIRGAILIKNKKIALCGDLPPIIKHGDSGMKNKITHHQKSNFL